MQAKSGKLTFHKKSDAITGEDGIKKLMSACKRLRDAGVYTVMKDLQRVGGEPTWVVNYSVLIKVISCFKSKDAYLGLSQDDCPARMISSWLPPNHPGCVDDLAWSVEECSQDDLKSPVALIIWIPRPYGLNGIPSDCIGSHRIA